MVAAGDRVAAAFKGALGVEAFGLAFAWPAVFDVVARAVFAFETTVLDTFDFAAGFVALVPRDALMGFVLASFAFVDAALVDDAFLAGADLVGADLADADLADLLDVALPEPATIGFAARFAAGADAAFFFAAVAAVGRADFTGARALLAAALRLPTALVEPALADDGFAADDRVAGADALLVDALPADFATADFAAVVLAGMGRHTPWLARVGNGPGGMNIVSWEALTTTHATGRSSRKSMRHVRRISPMIDKDDGGRPFARGNKARAALHHGRICELVNSLLSQRTPKINENKRRSPWRYEH